MSHPFGNLVSQHLHRKHGLSQSKLAAGIGQAPTVITAMCKGRRLVGPQARERVVAIIGWLHAQGALDTLDEANELLNAAGMSGLTEHEAAQSNLRGLAAARVGRHKPRSDPGGFERKHNLPAPATSLIGREDDVATARALLSRDDVRLITFLGPPGVGKTRLALQVAWQERDDYADGAWFVPLAGVDEPRHIAATIVQALELPPVDAPAHAMLRQHLRHMHLLLVLDNFEQLLGNADEANAATYVAELLAGAPGLKVLTTSRAALHVQGEHLFEVQPLAEQPAVELFAERARAVKPGFILTEANATAVSEISRPLDRLPLAIELAAARVRMFNPSQLLARLASRLETLTDGVHDLPARQRTLRGTIEWSYSLLSLEEQALFRRLGIFAGGLSLDAVELVAGEGLRMPVLGLVQSLADKSVIKLDVEDGETRVSLLETLRKYALEQLDVSGELDVLSKQHAEYYVRHTESIGDFDRGSHGVDGAAAPSLRRRLDREEGNWRAALAYARRSEDMLLLSRIVIAPMTLNMQLSPEGAGWLWLATLLAKLHESVPPRTRAQAMRSLASILYRGVSNLEQGWMMLEESARIFEGLGEAHEQAKCLIQLTILAWVQGNFTIGKQHAQRSVELLEHTGDDVALADAWQWFGAIARDQGVFEVADQLFKQSLAQYRRSKLLEGEGLTLNGMGDLAFDRGDYNEASTYYDGARNVWREWEVYSDFALRGLGRIAYQRGNLPDADELLSLCVMELRRLDNSLLLSFTLHHLGIVKHLRGDAAGMSLLHEALTLQHRELHRLQIAESLERFAWAAAGQHQPHRAVRLFGAADALRKWMGAPLPLGDKPLYDRYLEMTRAALNSDAFGQIWAEGAAMSLDQAVAYALADE